ncbi:tyrosine-type recombinase/integrase [Pedobacter psychroterrae]|uniref:Tyr recombinase domain-containing protein n=1 Tax=Pedobacter psychroterrae TaxID=2530453 RepID=A0A4R0NNL9_9SPHI|nr:tyrosine-type recombinase/integrase [Pedobacter psychroterrae]TCD02491.1 hypothetical protein EZ437_00440 [Pedobacter psychroterrae]
MSTARIILDTRRAKSNGLFPIKIRVANVKSWKLYTTGYSLSKEDFEKLQRSKNLNEGLKAVKRKLDSMRERADIILEKVDPFNFDLFETQFLNKGNRSDLLFLIRSKAKLFGENEQYSSQNLYNQTAAFLEAYVKGDKKDDLTSIQLPVKMVTAIWLQNLERWALKQTYVKKGKGLNKEVKRLMYNQTTIGMYLIRVRSVFNDIISNKELSPEAYPFHKADNKSGYKIPQAINNKRPLDLDRIMEFYNYKPANNGEQLAKDFFLFSYLSGGMNMVDIFKLKWSNIQNDQFSFIRKKTENKTGSAMMIFIPLREELNEIIDRQGSKKAGNDYIFNLIPANADEKELIRRTRGAISAINASLKKIAIKLGWEESPSTYFARHAFSNNQMNSEVPLAHISKQLGHKNIKTTQNYLDNFTTGSFSKSIQPLCH